MSTSIIERPQSPAFSMNEIRYVFQSTDTTAQGFYLEVRIKASYDQVNFYTAIKTVVLKPNADGKTYFYVQDFINSYLKWELPIYTAAETAATAQTVRFYVEFREGSIAGASPTWTSDSGNVCRGYKGGIEKQVWSGNNYFDWQATTKAFLTWQPSGRFIHYNQPQFISFNNSSNDVKRRLTVVATDGSTFNTTFNLSFDTNTKLYHLNISPAFLDLNTITGGKQVHYYDVSILDGANADAVIHGPYRLYIDYSPVYDEVWDFIYLNSLGGVDCARVRGEYDWNYEIENGEGSGNLDTAGAGSTLMKAENVNTRSVRNDLFKGDIGYCRTRAEQEAYIDLLMSDYRFIWKNGRYIQVHMVNRSGRVRKSADTKYPFPIEWQMPFSNSVFTPRGINLAL